MLGMSGVALYVHVAPLPEVIQKDPLLLQEILETADFSQIQGLFDRIIQLPSRKSLGGMVRHKFRNLYGLTGLPLARKDDLALIFRTLAADGIMACRFYEVVDAANQLEVTVFSFMAEDYSLVLARV